MPSEDEIIKTYTLSRFTVRQALHELESEGWVKRVQGKGTFVSEHRIPLSVAWYLLGFSEDMRRKGHKVESRIIEQKTRIPEDVVADILRIDKGTPVLFIKRLRLIDAEPFLVDFINVRIDLCPGIESIDLENKSLFNIFENKYNLRIARGIRTLKIKLADRHVASLLELKPNVPLFQLVDLLYTEKNIPIHFANTFINEIKSEFVFELIRPRNIEKIRNINIDVSTFPHKR